MLIGSLALDYELALRGILIGMEFYSHCIKASDLVYRLKTQLSCNDEQDSINEVWLIAFSLFLFSMGLALKFWKPRKRFVFLLKMW